MLRKKPTIKLLAFLVAVLLAIPPSSFSLPLSNRSAERQNLASPITNISSPFKEKLTPTEPSLPDELDPIRITLSSLNEPDLWPEISFNVNVEFNEENEYRGVFYFLKEVQEQYNIEGERAPLDFRSPTFKYQLFVNGRKKDDRKKSFDIGIDDQIEIKIENFRPYHEMVHEENGQKATFLLAKANPTVATGEAAIVLPGRVLPLFVALIKNILPRLLSDSHPSYGGSYFQKGGGAARALEEGMHVALIPNVESMESFETILTNIGIQKEKKPDFQRVLEKTGRTLKKNGLIRLFFNTYRKNFSDRFTFEEFMEHISPVLGKKWLETLNYLESLKNKDIENKALISSESDLRLTDLGKTKIELTREQSAKLIFEFKRDLLTLLEKALRDTGMDEQNAQKFKAELTKSIEANTSSVERNIEKTAFESLFPILYELKYGLYKETFSRVTTYLTASTGSLVLGFGMFTQPALFIDGSLKRVATVNAADLIAHGADSVTRNYDYGFKMIFLPHALREDNVEKDIRQGYYKIWMRLIGFYFNSIFTYGISLVFQRFPSKKIIDFSTKISFYLNESPKLLGFLQTMDKGIRRLSNVKPPELRLMMIATEPQNGEFVQHTKGEPWIVWFGKLFLNWVTHKNRSETGDHWVNLNAAMGEGLQEIVNRFGGRIKITSHFVAGPSHDNAPQDQNVLDIIFGTSQPKNQTLFYKAA